MGNDKAVLLAAPAMVEDALRELLRTGARRLIEAALAAEFEECLSGFADERLPDGRQRVVRNGHLPRREILTGIGAVEVEVPKLRSRSGSSVPFRSSLVPPYVRRSASLDAAVPWLYLHGVSTGQMRAAVSALVGEEAARGLSSNVVSRLKRSWDEEYRSWCRRSLADDWVYVWADGIHSGLRGAGERLCVLVVIGVNARGDKHFLAIEDGVRESTQSWREVLVSMKQRGLTRPAKLAVGDEPPAPRCRDGAPSAWGHCHQPSPRAPTRATAVSYTAKTPSSVRQPWTCLPTGTSCHVGAGQPGTPTRVMSVKRTGFASFRSRAAARSMKPSQRTKRRSPFGSRYPASPPGRAVNRMLR